MTVTDFEKLSPHLQPSLWQALYTDAKIRASVNEICAFDDTYHELTRSWQVLDDSEASQTQWLVLLFNHLYAQDPTPTLLVHGGHEPEYFAARDGQPARIGFAHGFFQSALHEISHWCVAGHERRQLGDFGYWYCPDGRDAAAQRQFEQVEIKPQAIECLMSLALGRRFYVSADNLNADFDNTDSTFAQDVYAQAYSYLTRPHTLPKDAKRLIWVFLNIRLFGDKS